jgi:hypothetical protein
MDRYAQIFLLQSDASKRLQAWLKKYLPIFEENEAEVGTPIVPWEKRPANLQDPKLMPTQCREMDSETMDAMMKVQALVRLRGLDTIRGWAARGIQNLPLAFVAGMGKIGLKWGSCYGSSKDIMHFELIKDGTNDDSFIEPDSKRRPLQEIMARWGQSQTHSHAASKA